MFYMCIDCLILLCIEIGFKFEVVVLYIVSFKLGKQYMLLLLLILNWKYKGFLN